MDGIVAHFGQRACGIHDISYIIYDLWRFTKSKCKPKFTLVGVYLELIQDFSLSWNFTQIKGSIAKSQRSMRIRKWFHYIHPLIDLGRGHPDIGRENGEDDDKPVMGRWRMDVKREEMGWHGRGKQRSCTDGAVPETLTVGPKIWRIFEKRGEKKYLLLVAQWTLAGPSRQLAARSKENVLSTIDGCAFFHSTLFW